MCAKLKRNQYGTRDAGQNFELFVHDSVEDMGFKTGLWSPCVLYHEQRDMRAHVYGDNFVILGAPAALDWFHAELQKVMWVKGRGPSRPRMCGVRGCVP